MKKLAGLLKAKNYKKIPLVFSKAKHLEAELLLNGVPATFIVDTGASNTCIGTNQLEKFKITAENSDVKAAGAGAIDMDTQLSKNNKIQIGKLKIKRVNLVIFELDNVNQALGQHGIKPVDGILGADILENYHAIIDYKKMVLYLKK
ncbi:MAG: retroviral-like aspartic protease family protein [Flavobacteriaceae bacterium]|nr:retroviral-like aspartic protease family protein [Flavobacteriaceae bacterium]